MNEQTNRPAKQTERANNEQPANDYSAVSSPDTSGPSSAANATHEQPKTRVILTLSLIPLIMVLGNSMIVPVLPQAKKALDISQFQVSLLITLFSVPAGIAIIFAGILADRIGRKKVIIPGLFLYGLGGIIAGLAAAVGDGSYALLLGGRIVQGIGAAGTAPIAMTLVGDLYDRKQRSKALGIIEASNGVGKVLSPILGSLLALITWYALFFAFPLLCLPAILFVWWFIREPTAGQKPPPLNQYKERIVNIWKSEGKWLTAAFLAGAVTLFLLFGVLFYLSDILEKTYKIDGIKKGLVLAIPLLAMSGTSYWCGSFIQKHIRFVKPFVVFGLALLTIVMGLVPFIKQNVLLIALLVVGGIGSGLVLPCLNTLITSSVRLAERGIITSLYNSVRFFGVALGPPVFGAFMDAKTALFLTLSGVSAISCVSALAFIKRPHRLKSNNGHERTFTRPHVQHP
ncbi:MFS transporter [Numidum massiliense]|uniref:MFS transporter n=1 Tax=Numidum massiliense TaxID=1522315 RepID=UPI0009E9C8C0|nr:MFS transporter [Numidum massiliense]